VGVNPPPGTATEATDGSITPSHPSPIKGEGSEPQSSWPRRGALDSGRTGAYYAATVGI
jgi:hypothetical protein